MHAWIVSDVGSCERDMDIFSLIYKIRMVIQKFVVDRHFTPPVGVGEDAASLDAL